MCAKTLALLLLVSLSASPVFAGEETSAYAQAIAAYQDRQLDKALKYAKEAVSLQADHIDAQFLLGHLYYLRQELQKARECWQRAMKLAPGRQDIREALERLERETAIERDLSRNDVHPFIVRFAQGRIPIETDALRQMLRDTYRKVGQSFAYFPDHPITVLLYPPADFDKVRGVSHQVLGFYDGKIRLPIQAGGLPGEELERVLWHEYTHALVHDLSKGKCPLWLNEGIATLQESRVRPVDVGVAKKAFQAGQLPRWRQLWGQGYRASALAEDYQTAYLLAQYLVKRWGWRELVDLLKRLGQGYPVEDALRAQYGSDPAGIEKEWQRWLRNRL